MEDESDSSSESDSDPSRTNTLGKERSSGSSKTEPSETENGSKGKKEMREQDLPLPETGASGVRRGEDKEPRSDAKADPASEGRESYKKEFESLVEEVREFRSYAEIMQKERLVAEEGLASANREIGDLRDELRNTVSSLRRLGIERDEALKEFHSERNRAV